MGDGDDDAFVGDQVFDGDFAFVGDQLGQARRGVFFFDLLQLRFDDGEDAGLPGQYVEQILDAFEQLRVFGADLAHFQSGQLVEAQVQNGVGLGLAEGIAPAGQARFAADDHADLLDLLAGEIEGQQLDFGLLAVAGLADDADEFIQIGQRDEVAFQRFGALLGLAQLEAGAANDDFAAMLDVAIDQLLEAEGLGPAVIDGQGVDGETAFQRGMLVEIIDDNLGDGVALDLDDHARVFIRFIAHGGDVGDDFLVDQLGDALDQDGAVDVVGNLGDDDLLAAALEFLQCPPCRES